MVTVAPGRTPPLSLTVPTIVPVVTCVDADARTDEHVGERRAVAHGLYVRLEPFLVQEPPPCRLRPEREPLGPPTRKNRLQYVAGPDHGESPPRGRVRLAHQNPATVRQERTN